MPDMTVLNDDRDPIGFEMTMPGAEAAMREAAAPAPLQARHLGVSESHADHAERAQLDTVSQLPAHGRNWWCPPRLPAGSTCSPTMRQRTALPINSDGLRTWAICWNRNRC
jgi:hypothetical protein